VAREGAAEGVDGVEIVAVVADVAIAGSRTTADHDAAECVAANYGAVNYLAA